MSLTLIQTIPEFLERTVRIWPDRVAYSWFDRRTNQWAQLTWRDFSAAVMRWRKAFARMGLVRGDRVSMLLPNSIEALIFDQAALANGLVPVPLHAIDTAGSSAYILKDSGAKFLVTVSYARWNCIVESGTELPDLARVVLTNEYETGVSAGHIEYCGLEEWLATGNDVAELPQFPQPQDLAALVYTSGTTGRPKGVMLTHSNIVSNVQQIAQVIKITEKDVYLSFLPLSHCLERTCTYYSALAHGAQVTFSRGVQQLAEDLTVVNPTILYSVPRVFERMLSKFMAKRKAMSVRDGFLFDWAIEAGWNRFCRNNAIPVPPSAHRWLDVFVEKYLDAKVGAKVRRCFGSNFRYLIVGGAGLTPPVARFFCGMGITIRQGYGLTETTPVISVSREGGNHPATVGEPIPGVEARIGPRDELQVRGPNIMKGYWNRPEETKNAFTEDGWLCTGDQVDMSDGGRIRIKGRIKEIIVTSVGEKISPVDLEVAIQENLLFEQVMIVGENRPYIAALVVLDKERLPELCQALQLDPNDPATLGSRELRTAVLKRLRTATKHFPRYGQPRNVAILPESWTLENGLLTTTLKLRRSQIAERYATEIEDLYAGHDK